MISQSSKLDRSNTATLMQNVQASPWNPFKFNEIVTLERCLHEISLDDPRFSTILRKLALESVFVDPTRKQQHLNRNKTEELADIELRKRVNQLTEQIGCLDEKIDYYRTRLNNLIEQEQENRVQIFQLKKSIVSKDNICNLLSREFDLMLERVFNSFVASISIIKMDIPDFIASIKCSNLVKQTESLPSLHRRHLITLIENYERYQLQQHLSMQLGYCFKKVATTRLNDYLRSVTNLYRDLSLIDKVYSNEIPEELDHLRVLETHIDYLEKPIISKAPKRVTYVYDDNIEQPPIEQLQLTGSKPDDELDDTELDQMFNLISQLCKYSECALDKESFSQHQDERMVD